MGPIHRFLKPKRLAQAHSCPFWIWKKKRVFWCFQCVSNTGAYGHNQAWLCSHFVSINEPVHSSAQPFRTKTQSLAYLSHLDPVPGHLQAFARVHTRAKVASSNPSAIFHTHLYIPILSLTGFMSLTLTHALWNEVMRTQMLFENSEQILETGGAGIEVENLDRSCI